LLEVSEFVIEIVFFLHSKHALFGDFTDLFLEVFDFGLELLFNFLVHNGLTFQALNLLLELPDG